MKTTIKLLSLIALFLFVTSCGQQKEESTEVEQDQEWPEMDAFHMTMAEVFHPFKDSANLEPAIRLAPELAAGADKWLNAPLPEKVNNDEVKAKLQELKEGTASFSQLVTSGDTTQIKESLTKLHDQFHALQEAFYSNGKHEHGEHEHQH